jgi:hypothetical protein
MLRIKLRMLAASLLVVSGLFSGCGADAGQQNQTTAHSTRLRLEVFERGGLDCYELVDLEAVGDSVASVAENCPDEDFSGEGLRFEEVGTLDDGLEYLVVRIPAGADVVEASGAVVRNGEWLAVEGPPPSGGYQLRLENLGGEFLCSVSFPLEVACELL